MTLTVKYHIHVPEILAVAHLVVPTGVRLLLFPTQQQLKVVLLRSIPQVQQKFATLP